MSAALAIAPLVARVEPVAGESLMSLVARAAHANVMPRPSDLLRHAGVTGHPAFAPFTATPQQGRALAQLLSVDEQEVSSRMHAPIPSAQQKGLVEWAGVRMERRFIEARSRRVAPGALQDCAHHRLLWTHRALSFCPETFELLISQCPSCQAPLGWAKTYGPDLCEHCRVSLLESDPDYVCTTLHARLRAATKLISPDALIRHKVRAALPAEFLDWDAGELFAALVELGVAWEHPGEGRGSPTAEALSDGRIGLVTPTHIARGYEALQGWPDSFSELVGRIWRNACQVDPRASVALRQLGVLGRRFDSRQSEGALARLLREHIERAAEKAQLPLKLGHVAHFALAAAKDETLGLKQASDLFGIAEPVLKRLLPDGECLISGRLGRGGALRFDKARLVESALTYRFTGRPEVVAGRLGVPAYCLPAFFKAGLLRSITDADALRMAGAHVAYDLYSLDKLETKILGRERREEGSDARFARLIAGRFCPHVWAKAFKALAAGKLVIDDLRGTGPLSRRLWVDGESAETLLARLVDGPAPWGATVTAAEAALLLGVSDVYVPELIAVGALAATRDGRVWKLKLHDVISFYDRYEFSPAVGAAAVGRALVNSSRSLLPPHVSTRHLSLWLRY